MPLAVTFLDKNVSHFDPYIRDRGSALNPTAYQKAYALFRLRLKEARRQAGLTLAEVAKALRRPQSFISKCESGERRVDYVEWKEFSRLY